MSSMGDNKKSTFLLVSGFFTVVFSQVCSNIVRKVVFLTKTPGGTSILVDRGGGGGLDLDSSLEAKFGVRSLNKGSSGTAIDKNWDIIQDCLYGKI